MDVCARLRHEVVTGKESESASLVSGRADKALQNGWLVCRQSIDNILQANCSVSRKVRARSGAAPAMEASPRSKLRAIDIDLDGGAVSLQQHPQDSLCKLARPDINGLQLGNKHRSVRS